ncbi:MAG TPA: Sec-independent protein translocase protein TatB [Rhizomicrobium sp.]|nr:Sec-independent protein translocase protein TatB [Rhizomicrobium sp.]
MFDLSWSHILIFLVVALVVVGPKDMPRLLRMVGQWVAKARGMANEFRKSFDEMARQSELDELRQEIENLRRERPLSEFENEMNTPADAPVMRPLGTPALDPGPAMDVHNHAVQDVPEHSEPDIKP